MLRKRSGGLFRVAVEAVRGEQKRRRPKADEEAEPLGVRRRVDRLPTGQKPDGDGANDRGETEDAA